MVLAYSLFLQFSDTREIDIGDSYNLKRTQGEQSVEVSGHPCKFCGNSLRSRLLEGKKSRGRGSPPPSCNPEAEGKGHCHFIL